MLRCTYRLQLTPELTLPRAAQHIAYLARLGVSHVYLSPIFEAVPGSTHGYDVTDPTRIRDAIGGLSGYRAFVQQARAAGLGIIIDIVPNHMAAHAANPWWWDVLRNGRTADAADLFDVDWDAGGGRIILAALGRPLEEAIAQRELEVSTGSPHDSSEAVLRYYDDVYPLRPGVDPHRTPLPELIDRQHYKLMFWRDGEDQLNYRRFFDIDDLAAVRVEDESVFERTHALIAELAAQRLIDGVRVDHVDGLRDPSQYLQRLRALLDQQLPEAPRITIHVEKILMGDESLPSPWGNLVEGTTGYEFISATEPIFVDQVGFRALETEARAAARIREPFHELCVRTKSLVLAKLFTPEMRRLTDAITAVADQAGQPRHAHDAWRAALSAVTAALAVYRTYHGEAPPSESEHMYLARAFTAAAELLRDDSRGRSALASLQVVLCDLPYDPDHAACRHAAVDCIRSWQQLSGPAAAKGVEDTALYRHIVLSSLNEVGCEPVVEPDCETSFHEANRSRAASFPNSMITTATHDTKRGEDTRARIHVLSERSEQWNAALRRWSDWHAPFRRQLEDGPCPNPTHEVLLYQSLIGIWPADQPLDDSIAQRLSDYLIKAAREAKRRTSWRSADEEYEDGLRAFTQEVVLGEGGARFRRDVQPLLRDAMLAGAINSLSQLTAKVTAPGIPDFYQGTELWQLVLVDPDNRRPVDFQRHQELIDTVNNAPIEALRESWRDGRIKLALLHKLLRLRAHLADLFACGSYEPLHAIGPRSKHVWAFMRRHANRALIAAGARLSASSNEPAQWPIGDVWASTELQIPPEVAGRWRCAINDTAGTIERHTVGLKTVFVSMPVGVLVMDEL